MSRPSIRPLVALAGAVILTVGLVGSAAAQEPASPSPTPSLAPAGTLEWHAERAAPREERRSARQAERALRAAGREASREARRELRAKALEDRAEARAARKAQRASRQAAMTQVREACADELAAARSMGTDDRAAWRTAVRAARAACRDLYLAALEDAPGQVAPLDEVYTEAAAGSSSVVTTQLGTAEPTVAPGEELGLWHYYIPAQTELSPHTHPGWQLARVTSGELEYIVYEGEGILLRADGSQESMGPGTYTLATGDGVIENPELVHQGANRTDEPVTLISATLFEAGEPASTIVEEGPAADEVPAAG